jgi:hypothetical protein
MSCTNDRQSLYVLGSTPTSQRSVPAKWRTPGHRAHLPLIRCSDTARGTHTLIPLPCPCLPLPSRSAKCWYAARRQCSEGYPQSNPPLLARPNMVGAGDGLLTAHRTDVTLFKKRIRQHHHDPICMLFCSHMRACMCVCMYVCVCVHPQGATRARIHTYTPPPTP